MRLVEARWLTSFINCSETSSHVLKFAWNEWNFGRVKLRKMATLRWLLIARPALFCLFIEAGKRFATRRPRLLLRRAAGAEAQSCRPSASFTARPFLRLPLPHAHPRQRFGLRFSLQFAISRFDLSSNLAKVAARLSWSSSKVVGWLVKLQLFK